MGGSLSLVDPRLGVVLPRDDLKQVDGPGRSGEWERAPGAGGLNSVGARESKDSSCCSQPRDLGGSRRISTRTSPSLNQSAISFSAFSAESEPWQMLRPTTMEKSPRMVPGSDSCGFVAPSICRPILTAFSPCQTMQQTGPESMYESRSCGRGAGDRSVRRWSRVISGDLE